MDDLGVFVNGTLLHTSDLLEWGFAPALPDRGFVRVARDPPEASTSVNTERRLAATLFCRTSIRDCVWLPGKAAVPEVSHRRTGLGQCEFPTQLSVPLEKQAETRLMFLIILTKRQRRGRGALFQSPERRRIIRATQGRTSRLSCSPCSRCSASTVTTQRSRQASRTRRSISSSCAR
jgi:hypothetical protein